MLRERLNETLKGALKRRATVEVATVRLILAALKDRDIDARGKGNMEGICDAEVLRLLHSRTAKEMVQGVITDVRKHARGAEPSDDITLLVLKRG